MATYRPTIGLEIHAELKTATKMFCGCLNNPDEKVANKNVCAVCLAHPGTLPVINREAVHKVLLVGKAVGGTLADFTEFDRKNYFYPDIPKGYQISQYQHPLVKDGILATVALTRIHLEEDTARSQHVGDKSLVDYNRAGVPLMELVTEPVLHDAASAGAFARELQLLLRYLGAGEANMEKGEMRLEANVSVSPDDTLGTKVEVKNINSFKAVEGAIAYEIKRQIELIEKGEKIVQETRGWDDQKQVTFSQRKKESSHDYRYFPDPDLPKLIVSEVPEFSATQLESQLPELPWQKRDRLNSLGFLQVQDVEQLIADAKLATLFNEIEKMVEKPELLKIAANFILNDIAGQRKKDSSWAIPSAEFLSTIVVKFSEGALASPQAKSSILSGVVAQTTDASLIPAIAKKVVEANPTVVADYKNGKEASLMFLVGQGMKESKGQANPQVLRTAIIEAIG